MYIKNLGPIKKSQVDLNDFSIFIGDNNTGKTYTSYMIYAILKYFSEYRTNIMTDEEIQTLSRNGSVIFNKKEKQEMFLTNALDNLKIELPIILGEAYNISVDEFINTEILFENIEEVKKLLGPSFFEGTMYGGLIFGLNKKQDFHFNFEYEEESIEISFLSAVKSGVESTKLESMLPNKNSMVNVAINDTVYEVCFTPFNVSYMPAERIGLNVFRKELGRNRIRLNQKQPNIQTAYPLALKDYLDFLFDMSDSFSETNLQTEDALETNELYYSIKDELEDNILKGIFEYNEETDEYLYRKVYRKVRGKNQYSKEKIPFHLISSSLKSLFGLDYYLSNIAKKGDYLMIDEPEMNLHPAKQSELAKILSKLVEAGVRVIISTHSNFLVRKVTNILIKNSNEQQGISADSVSINHFLEREIENIGDFTKSPYVKNFDEVSIDIDNEYYSYLNLGDNYE